MAIQQVRAQVNGVWYTLTYDGAQKCYVATIPAGETSADQPGGYYNVTVEAANDAGETVSIDGEALASLRLVVKDLTAPTLTLVSPAQGYVTTQTPEIVVDLTDDSSGVDPATLSVTTDGAPEAGVSTSEIDGGYRVTVSPNWADGVHTVELSVSDQDGNTGTLALLYTVDTTPPVLAVWPHRLVVNADTVALRGMAADSAGAAVTVSTGAWSSTTAPAADGSWRVSVPLEIGVNSITVTATDGAGLTTSWTGTVVRLITDRAQADLDAVRAILARLNAGTASAADLAAINSPTQRGAYNYTDLNRVSAAEDMVYQSLIGQGISVDYALVELERPNPGRLPDGYTELEYIESSGTQYIDTGFKQNQNSRIVMSAQVTQQPSKHAWLFEGRISTGSGGKSVFLLNGVVWNADYNGSARREAFPDIGIFDALSIDFDKNSLQINEDSFTWTTSTFQSTENLALLACNTAGAISGYISAKLYNCQIYDNGTMVRDFVPCQDPTGNIGLYDLVNGRFYGNSGDGVFLPGPEVPVLPPVIDYEWSEEDVPTVSQMEQYLSNVKNLLAARLVQGQYIALPTSMMSLTVAGANNIEWALVCVDAMTPVVRKSYLYSGEAMAGEF